MTDYSDLDALFGEMDQSAERARQALEGSLSEQYKALRSLDPATVQDITPDISDEAMYEKLMATVQEASARNESQAQLATRIKTLGGVAVKIASKVPALARIL